jgi:acyl carrier protein
MSSAATVKEIIAEHLGVEAETLKDEASLVRDLGIDSLDLAELVIAFERTFKVRIPPDQARQIRTVGAVIAFIDASSPAPLRKSA